MPGDDLTYRVDKILSWYIDMQELAGQLDADRGRLKKALKDIAEQDNPIIYTSGDGHARCREIALAALATPPDTLARCG